MPQINIRYRDAAAATLDDNRSTKSTVATSDVAVQEDGTGSLRNKDKPQLKIDTSSRESAPSDVTAVASRSAELCQGDIAEERSKSSPDAAHSFIQEQRVQVRRFVDEQIALEQQSSDDASSSNRLQQIYQVHRLNRALKEGRYVEFLPEHTQYQSFAEIRDQLAREQEDAGADEEPGWTACEQYMLQLMSTKQSEESASVDAEEVEL
jgi:hypothetical protein